MDFLDPKTERRSRTKLLTGYCLMALAIGIATLLLLYQAEGFNIDQKGKVTQNGLLYVSSQPSGASIYLNGQPYTSRTNTRVLAPAGRYTVKVSKTGYRDWQRQVWVAGGDVQHFDYPFLVPQTLSTGSLADLSADPTLATQSPDKRWLLLGSPEAAGLFTQYDLKNAAKPVVSTLTLPAASFTPGSGAQTWAVVEWAADNRHVLLQHTYTPANGSATREYVLLDRDTPTLSVNLTSTLNLTQDETVNLFNNRTDQYYVYNAATQMLLRVNGDNGTEQSQLTHILAFKTYGDDKILYVTDESPTGKATPGQVTVVLQDGQQTYSLRTLPPAGNGTYVLNLAQYSGDWYVAVASSSDSTAYVYKNPQQEASNGPDTFPAPWRRIPLGGVSYLSFSSNTQFLAAENGQRFVVYDLEDVAQYSYQAAEPLDQPQAHAAWMDGDRLAYVSGGKLEMFDYDYQNRQTLVDANAAYLPFFSGNYTYLYTLRPVSATSKAALTSTSLVVK